MQVRPLSSVLKCFQLLEVAAEQQAPIRISNLSRLTGESRATTYQRLHTLTIAGWMERLPDGGYRLSTRACRFGAAAMQQAGFGERTQPLLDELAAELSEAVSLVLLEQDRLVIAQRAESRSMLRADLKVGAELSYKDSASGAIWLAFGPTNLSERVREAGHTLPSTKRISKALKEAISIGGGGRTLPDISAIAIPVLDLNGQCLGSLSTTSPASRFQPEHYLPAMRRAAEQMANLSDGEPT
ncbi:MAG: helix-turn-helix domain-containing protein [Paracoccaceae bacterium]|jgi:DNA-binding IclR family transcriptional regulator|nr:helix-turn-helix domain-containing protein [Paracoccaceae bacterium]MDG2259582.1 helix-turn-helix domain-containing protein [Paracoccaceae bacterium]